MEKLNSWDGQVENTEIEYEIVEDASELSIIKTPDAISLYEYNKADKMDYVLAASCGVLTGLLDSFWVGEFSLENAQNWVRRKVNSFVIRVAQLRGYEKNGLDGAIRFLEKDAPMASDKLTNVWGGGLQHHFRDFAHHASIVGLVFSLLSQFTGMSYGTNTDGMFEIFELPDKSLIGKNLEEKLFNGIVLWMLHLVSDMAGSSSSAGKGTGIPGPMLSMAKELSVLPEIQNIHVNYKENHLTLSTMLAKIFNGSVFEETGIRFDLRTEIGVYAYSVKQSIPVVLNQCVTRAFYFVRRLCLEINQKNIQSITDTNLLNTDHFLPYNNKCIRRMATISSGVFCVVDVSDATIRALISGYDSKGAFAVKLLLRTNFVGIGNFVISLRNDISANIFSNTNDVVTIEKKVAEQALATDNITIDVCVHVDNTGIYEYAFYRMFESVKKIKEEFSLAMQVDQGMQEAILQLEDNETRLFDVVAKASYHSLIVETEDLIMRLFAFYGIQYVSFEDDSKYRWHAPFYRIESNKKIAYVFTRTITENIPWKDIRENLNVDGIKQVALVELGEDSETRNIILREQARKTGGFIDQLTLEDLFSLISDSEYEMYKSYVVRYNDDIKKLIGYRTIVVPSESSLTKMKQKIKLELKNFHFDELLEKEGIYKEQVCIINGKFWDRELYKAMLGSRSFAESFISSEWYYQTHTASTALEQTAIIAGYLKSIEQLLYSIIELSKNSGKTIKRKNGSRFDYIEYKDENLEFTDLTLGSIAGYARHYSELWDVNNFVKNYVADKLNLYHKKYRNDHFHKDNVNSIEEIEEIRFNTYLMHFLLLGAMKIDDSQKQELGILQKNDSLDKKCRLQYENLEKWLNRILGGDVLLPIESHVYFEVSVWGREQWKLEFTTITGFSDRNYPENMKWPYIGDDLKWERINDEENKYEVENQVITMVERCLEEGKYANNCKRQILAH